MAMSKTGLSNLFSKRTFLEIFFGSVVYLSLGCPLMAAGGNTLPNILWISCEDISSHLGCFGEKHAITPNIDKIASEGVRYTHAFTVHGVCAPSRTGIITGMYPSSFGSVNMRCKAKAPDHIKCFTRYLRDAGYYCTNCEKEDYNFVRSEDAWDQSDPEAHWKNRPAGKPFFSVFNFFDTHESKLWSSKDFENTRPKKLKKSQWQNPDNMAVPPLYPDTDAVRKDYARLFEKVTEFDRFVGECIDQLKQANLYEDTIIFIWSDHGNGLPRAKRHLYDTGTLSPLIVRIPEKYRVAGQGKPNSIDDQLVNFIDLGPTVMNLAGVEIPEEMHGRAFLGRNLSAKRGYIFGARQRIDERHDMVRAVRDKKYRYLRNFENYNPYFFHIEYAEKCNTMQELRKLYAEGGLDTAQAQWMADERPFEELYDLENDPYELCNLADDAKYASVKKKLRSVLEEWMLQTRDTGFLPEPELLAGALEYGSEYTILHRPGGEQLLEKLLKMANIAGRPQDSDRPQIDAALKDENASVRYWAVTAIGQLKEATQEDLLQLEKATADTSPSVRIAAARSLYWKGDKDMAVKVAESELNQDSPPAGVVHFAMEALDNMLPESASAVDSVKKIQANNHDPYVKDLIGHFFSKVNM
jgi:uncharacterized sulfatase